MKQVTSVDELKIGDLVMVNMVEPFIGKVTSVTVTDPPHKKHRARVYDVEKGEEESLLWYDVENLSTIDTDEERQRLHDGSYVEANQDYSVVMGPVNKVTFGETASSRQTTVAGAGPAARLLEESLAILVERGKRYDNERGSPSITFTARLWDAYIESHARTGGPFTEVEVCEMIALHKMARRLQDRAGRDHHLDMVNYAALAGGFSREEPGDDR